MGENSMITSEKEASLSGSRRIMRRKLPKWEERTSEQIWEHYQIEKELADRLRHASKEERRCLYSSLYDELYQSVPLHSMLTRISSRSQTAVMVRWQMMFLRSCLDIVMTFVEVCRGDCALSF